jgi:hypothetical protein
MRVGLHVVRYEQVLCFLTRHITHAWNKVKLKDFSSAGISKRIVSETTGGSHRVASWALPGTANRYWYKYRTYSYVFPTGNIIKYASSSTGTVPVQ